MTDDLSAIVSYKKNVDTRLLTYLSSKKKELTKVNSWGADAIDRLKPFVVAGKTIRGSLVIWTYTLFRSEMPLSMHDAAAAIELFHAGFLIHDDIMDRSLVRRGKPSIHTQLGVPMAINAGDLCFFLGMELSTRAFVAKELQNVVIAQMMDVSGQVDDRESLYRYKTARYTFSLPMILGATLAGAGNTIISQFDRLGEYMGLVYQIRDDELDNDTETLKGKATYIKKAKEIIEKLLIDNDRKRELTALLLFCGSRTK